MRSLHSFAGLLGFWELLFAFVFFLSVSFFSSFLFSIGTASFFFCRICSDSLGVRGLKLLLFCFVMCNLGCWGFSRYCNPGFCSPHLLRALSRSRRVCSSTWLTVTSPHAASCSLSRSFCSSCTRHSSSCTRHSSFSARLCWACKMKTQWEHKLFRLSLPLR